MRKALNQLLSNAVKFNRDGGRVKLSLRRGMDGGIEIAVADTGIGIAQEDIPRMFQPFVQLDASHARRYGGIGIGLPLVSRLSEACGGSVSVESEVGKGSVFTLYLPFSSAGTGGFARDAGAMEDAATPLPRGEVADDRERLLLGCARKPVDRGQLGVAAVHHRGVEEDQRDVVRVRPGGSEVGVRDGLARHDRRARREPPVEGDVGRQVAEIVDAVRRRDESRGVDEEAAANGDALVADFGHKDANVRVRRVRLAVQDRGRRPCRCEHDRDNYESPQ